MTPTKELAPIEGELLPEPLSENKAKALDKRIRAAGEKVTANIEALWDLLEQAANGQIHVALGFPSWTAYVKDAVQIATSDRVERKELAKMMAGKGMSQRAIAGALGVSQKTIDRDLEGESSDSTEVTNGGGTVTGLDGKSYSASKPREDNIIEAEVVEDPEAEEPQYTAADVIEEFKTEVDNLLINMQAFKDVVTADAELFEKARKRIAQRFTGKLKAAAADLEDLINLIAGEAE